MEKTQYHLCNVCGYEYHSALGDPSNGVPPGTLFDEIPDHWSCPICDADHQEFSPKETYISIF